MLHLADRGMVTLTDNGGSWTVTNVLAPEKWAAIDPVATAVADAPSAYARRAAASRQRPPSRRARPCAGDHGAESAVRSWSGPGSLAHRLDGLVGRLGIVLSLLAALVIGLVAPLVLALPFAVFAVLRAALFAMGCRAAVRIARESWMKAAGFRKFLSTPSSEDQFDFAARGDLWIAYVPYAVAFGCADAWPRIFPRVGRPQTADADLVPGAQLLRGLDVLVVRRVRRLRLRRRLLGRRLHRGALEQQQRGRGRRLQRRRRRGRRVVVTRRVRARTRAEEREHARAGLHHPW